MSALVNTTEEDIYKRKSIGLGTELKVNKTALETSARFTEMNAGFDNTYPLEDADFESLGKTTNAQHSIKNHLLPGAKPDLRKPI
jgi:hypothetical protein